jgi:hypothetical protein
MAFGAVLLTISFVRSESKPYLPSALVAYELFMPLSASAFGVGNGIGDLWPHGALVFIVHLAWATIFGLITLAILRFRPLSGIGYPFALGIFAMAVLTVFWLIDPSKAPPVDVDSTPESTVSVSTQTLPPPPSETPSPAAPPSATPVVLRPTSTESTPEEIPEPTSAETTGGETITPVPLTLDITLPVTETRTTTPAPEPTPVYAVIRAREGGGAYIRKEPGGNVLATLDNGAIVQILPDTQEYNGILWIHIIATRNDIRVEGWIIQSVLETATPVPNWEPSETPNPAP